MGTPLIKEEEKRAAFEYYWILGLGGKLTINQRVERVAEKFKRDRGTIYKWKKNNNWDMMEEIKNDMVAAARDNLSPETLAVLESDLLLILDEIVKEYLCFVNGPDGKPLKIRNPLDLKRVIEAKNALTGGPPKKETKEVTHQGVVGVVYGDKELLEDLMVIYNGPESVLVNKGTEGVEGPRVEEADGGRSGSEDPDNESSTS